MFKRILVPLDGSVRAERVPPIAARLARNTNGTVILTRLVSPIMQYSLYFDLVSLPPSVVAAERAAAEAYLARVRERAEFSGVRAETIVLEALAVAPALLDIATTSRADLILISSHGRTGLLRWALGSVAQKIAHGAKTPLLVLHADGPAPLTESGRPVRVLVPLDGSSQAESALASAAQLASSLAAPAQGALHLLHVADVATSESEETSPEELATQQPAASAPETYLRAVAARFEQPPLHALNLQVTWSVARDVDVASAIVAEAEGGMEDLTKNTEAEPVGGYDLVAMATHGRTGLQLWTLGSVTDRVLQTSKLPLLIVRTPEAPQRPQGASAATQQQADKAITTWPDL